MLKALLPPRVMSRLVSFWSRVSLAAVLGCALGCNPAGARKDPEAAEDETEQPTPVVMQAIGSGDIDAAISAASTIEAERQVTVHAESTGRIVALTVEEGDEVDDNQLLARIEADVQAAGLDRASTNLDKARRDLEIVEKLHAQKVASKEELDAARLAYETAQLDVKDRRRDVRNAKVRAPFAGVVTQRFMSEGGFVTAGQQLVTITDFDTLVALVYVPEKELDRLAVGQPAHIVGKAARSRKGTGVVRRIAPVVDASTGTVKVTVGLPTELVGGDDGFLPGMYAEVTLTTDKHDSAVLVPKRGLIREDDEAYVFTVEGGRAKRVRLELGLENDEHAEVLSGLAPGDEIVVAGQAGLKDGGLIKRVDESGKEIAKSDAVAAEVAKTPDSPGGS